MLYTLYKDVYEVMMSAPKGHESPETDFIMFSNIYK